jgi:hypothetical protein
MLRQSTFQVVGLTLGNIFMSKVVCHQNLTWLPQIRGAGKKGREACPSNCGLGGAAP